MTTPPPTSLVIDTTTVLSLLSTLAILGLAYALSTHCLSANSSTKTRILFIWHAFDALIHFILEGSFLYGCFFSYVDFTSPSLSSKLATLPHLGGAGGSAVREVSEFLAPGVFWLGKRGRVYGALYGGSVFSALWREYAKADRRWQGTDLGVVSLEILTVGVMAPIAVWICVLLGRKGGGKGGAEWFWMTVVATGELYGGFMTFAPEWLTGSPNLDTSNFMYLWVYLFFFNTLWVWIPLWILYESYFAITGALDTASTGQAVRKSQ
ncbi:hypothetical protein MBLNU457_6513t1 [Dothideomycetes sp. NU457]